MWRLTAVAALMNLPAYPRVVTPTVVLPVSLVQSGSLLRRAFAWADVSAPGAARPSTAVKAAIQCVVLAASSAFGGRTARYQNVIFDIVRNVTRFEREVQKQADLVDL